MPVKYTFVSKDNDDWASIIIQEGKYEGIIYQYGQVSVAESEDENGNMPLSFKYNVIEYSGHNQEDLNKSVEFKNTLGDILVEILDDQLEANNLEYND